MSNRVIGKLISIRSGRITAEISSDIGEYINTEDGINFVGEVGTYVTIHDYNRDIIAEITGIDEQQQNGYQKYEKPNSIKCVYLNLLGEIQDKRFTFGVTRLPRLFTEINLISDQELDIILNIAESELPVKENSEDTYLKDLSIGKSTMFENYQVKINLDNFFGYHFAVFGNTGSGKSNTIANIIQRIFLKKSRSASGAHILIFDSNGEYNKALENVSEVNKEIGYKNIKVDSDDSNDKFEIPVWALGVDDWAILLNASQKTQIPVIRRAIQIVKVFNSKNNSQAEKLKNQIIASTIVGILTNSDSSPSRSDKLKSIITQYHTKDFSPDVDINEAKNEPELKLIDAVSVDFGQIKATNDIIEYCTPFLSQESILSDVSDTAEEKNVTFNFAEFINAMKFAVLYEGSVSSQSIQEYTAPMMSRVQALEESIIGKIFRKTDFSTTEDFVKDLIGNYQLVNIDVSSLDDSTGEVLLRVLSKMILDFQKVQKRNTLSNSKKAIYPINLIVEEAHRYISENKFHNELGFDIFERIAKEGRKFEFLLGISSQRPSELSSTVISQCSNFIIHRIQNPDDLNYISRMVPYIDKGIIDKLTYLKTGTALVFGTAINIPTLTEFVQANPKTDSNSAEISKAWFKLQG